MKTPLSAFCLCLLLVGAAAGDSLYVRQIGHQSSLFPNSGIAADGKYAYVASGGLYVISVADPTRPLAVGYCGSLGRARGVAVAGDFAYVADDLNNSLRVVSISDPAHPVLVGSCPTPDQAVKVAVRGQFAYVAARSDFCVISIADPRHPVMVGHLPGGKGEYNLDVRGDYAYVADFGAGLRIISIADPANPTEVGLFAGSPQAVAVKDSLACIGCQDGSFRVINISDPANPIEVSRVDNISGVDESQDIYAARGYAFVATWSGGLSIVSIADLAHMAEAAFYRIGSTSSLARQGRYAYVSADAGLYVLEFYQLGDIDIDPDSLDVSADTMRLRSQTARYGDSIRRASGEFILANTSASFNPDTTDGPSQSPVDSIGFVCSLAGPGGNIDSITIPNLPHSLPQGQTVVCSLSAYMPESLMNGDYTGTIIISGKDTAHLLVQCSCYVLVTKRAPVALGDLDVDRDSLNVAHDTMDLRTQPAGPVYHPYAKAEFMLVNTNSSYNPDTSDGPSQIATQRGQGEARSEAQDSYAGDCQRAQPAYQLAVGQAVECTLALTLPVHVPASGYGGWVHHQRFGHSGLRGTG